MAGLALLPVSLFLLRFNADFPGLAIWAGDAIAPAVISQQQKAFFIGIELLYNFNNLHTDNIALQIKNLKPYSVSLPKIL